MTRFIIFMLRIKNCLGMVWATCVGCSVDVYMVDVYGADVYGGSLN